MFERLYSSAAAGIIILSFACVGLAAAQSPAPADTTKPVYQEEEVVVTASRYGTDVHLSHTNMPKVEVRRRQSAVDIPMMLSDIPGVYSYSDAGNGIGYTYMKIRGFDMRRVGVLVNGIPLNDPEDHNVYWVNLPDLASSLEDVQVQRGITNGVGGVTAIGGSVNLVTDMLGDHPEGRATIEAGSYGTNRRMLSYKTGDLGQGFSTGLRLSQLESDGYRDRSGSEQWAVFWSGQWKNDKHLIQTNFYTGKELTQHAWDPAPEAELAKDRRYNPEKYWNAVDDFRQPHYELHWEWDLADNLLLKNSLYTIHGEGFYENYKGDRDAHDFSLDYYFPYGSDDDGAWGFTDSTSTDLVRTKWVRKDQTGWAPSLMWEHKGGRMVVGGDYYTFHSNHWGDVLMAGPDEGSNMLSPFDIPGGVKYHDFTGDKDAWSAYVNERWQFLPGLTLMADLQFQHRQYDFMQNEVGNFTGDQRNAYSVDYDFFNPKGGLFWDIPGKVIGGNLGLYGHVGVTQREPADSDYWGVWAGPDDLGQTPLFRTSETVYAANGSVDHVKWSDSVIEPEKVINYEGGLSYRANALSFTLNGYYMDFENEIVDSGLWDGDNNRAARTNADQTIHKGLELGLRWWVAHDHNLAMALSRSWNTYEKFVFELDGDTVDNSGNPIAGFPEALASATWTSRFGAFSGDLRYRYLGKQYLDNSGDEFRTIDGSNQVDLSLFLDIGRAGLRALDGMEAYVRVLNLFNEEFETAGYYDPWGSEGYQRHYTPGAPRHFLAGVNYDF